MLTSDLRIADYISVIFNDPDFSLYSRERVEGFIRKRRLVNQVIELGLTSQEFTGTPLPEPSNTDKGYFFEFIGSYAGLGVGLSDEHASNYGLSQTNVYVDGALDNSCFVDEVTVACFFPAETDGPVVIRGYLVPINEVIADIFDAIASDHSKLGIAQRTLNLSTDLTQAAAIARKQARYYRGIKSINIGISSSWD